MNKQKKDSNVYILDNYKLAPNRKIGKWKLAKLLGKGGNGEVWSCRDENRKEYAIKFLKWGSKKAYARFFDEISFMEKESSNITGVMPIIDKYIPENTPRTFSTEKPFYYVMPLASSIEDRIFKASVDEKIAIIKQLLEMLVLLHNHDIAHRDIKPSNILYFENRFVLSDFGLVFFRRKMSKTRTREKIGPKQTIAPQMEKDASSADAFKADVYSMAKTIWIILTNDSDSFGGQYLPNSVIGLREKMPECDKYFYPLDLLLSKCTDHAEDNRPTAIELCDEFNKWVEINRSWAAANLMQWEEVIRCLL